jgi:uncharacterized protein (TIGR03435 family)
MAQGQTAAGTEFEVASVKPAAPGQRPVPGDCTGRLVGGQFHCASLLLKPLLLIAYGLWSDQLEGPAWLGSERYSIVAKAPADAGNQQLPAMLQSLLVERFGMVTHWETREMPIYELTVAKDGPKLKTPEPAPASSGAAANAAETAPETLPMKTNKDGLPELPPGAPNLFVTRVGGDQWLTARMESIASLLNMLQFQIGRHVVDKTGLTGVYDFNLRWALTSARADAPPSDSGVDLIGAFEKQLGLKLTAKKGPVKFLVVDQANKTPTEN